MPKKTYNPEFIQQYIVATAIEGQGKTLSFKKFIDNSLTDSGVQQAIAKLEVSEQYTAILEMAQQHSNLSVNKAMADAVTKYYKRYGDLLDEGQKAIEGAENTDDRQKMMQEQRSNMMMPVIVNAQKQARQTKEIDTDGVIS